MVTNTDFELAGELTNLLGADRVSTAPAVFETHSIDKWHASASPDVVVLAKHRDDVVKTMRFADEHRIPVTTRGAGVGFVGGAVPIHGGIVLSVRNMDRIVEVNTGDGTAVVEPGVILLTTD